MLKNEIELMPTNLRTNSSLRGYLFMAFIALILRMKLMKMKLMKMKLMKMKLMKMKIDAELNKRYSVEGLLTQLEKIKIMVLPDGEKIATGISKRQREILDAIHDALRMCA